MYEAFRRALDAAYGYPSAETLTETAIPPADQAPRGLDGRVYIAVESAYCGYDLPAAMLADAIASDAVEELSQAQYEQAFREAAGL